MTTGLLTSDRVITVVRNTTDRDRLFPEPSRNQAVFRLDTYAFELWDGNDWIEVVPGDLPVTGDWDGNGRTDIGVWSPTTATFSQRRAAKPTAKRSSTTQLVFGNPR